MATIVDADAEKQVMVTLWAQALKEMPGTDFDRRDVADLESACACCYDAYLAALRGDPGKLRAFVKETAVPRRPSADGAADTLRALWAFRNVALSRHWSAAQLLSLDEVIHQATAFFAELHDGLRTEQGYLSLLKSLAIAIDSKDKYTSSHCQSVQRMAEIIADDLGVEIGYAGLFHDLGKIHVPDRILQKPGKLTPAEYDVVKQHAVHAYRILSPLPPPLPSVVLGHHERPDGRGYPLGLTEVPMPTAVVAVADTLHAIVSDRPYRPAKPFDEALEIINEVKGTQLREEPVEACNRVKEVLREVEAGTG